MSASIKQVRVTLANGDEVDLVPAASEVVIGTYKTRTNPHIIGIDLDGNEIRGSGEYVFVNLELVTRWKEEK